MTAKIIDRRMAQADTIYDNVPSLCWYDIIMWVYYDRPMALSGAMDCLIESRNCKACYCGRFRDGRDTDEKKHRL